MSRGPAGGATRRELAQLLARLRSRYPRQSLSTLLLGALTASSEGLGILLLIPLLALLGLSADGGGTWIDGLGLERLGFSANIYVVLGLFMALLALRQLVVFRQRMALARVRLDFSHDLRAELFEALTRAQWRYFSAGVLHRQVQILTNEANRAGSAAQQCFVLAAIAFLAAMQIAIAAWLSPGFTLAALAALLVTVFLFRDKLHAAAVLGGHLNERQRELYAITSNLLPLLRTAKMAGNGRELAAAFAASSTGINETLTHFVANRTANSVIIQLAAAFALSVALVLGLELFALSALSASILILVFARLTPQLAQALQVAQELLHSLPAFTLARQSIAEWRGRAETGADPRQGAALATPRRQIELRDVAAGFSDAAERQFLQGISLTLPVGAVTLLSGPTGAGKSTLADVVAGMLPPAAGAMLLDGRELGARQLALWRAQVGYVEQAAALFTGTLEENLNWGAAGTDRAWFDRVLKASTVADFLADIDGGLEGSVGEGGAFLSGGQRQRVAIARELMRKPALLVLDEATSGLDEATESTLLENIAALDPALTVLLISHRPGALRYAAQRIELERGCIARVQDPPERAGAAACGP